MTDAHTNLVNRVSRKRRLRSLRREVFRLAGGGPCPMCLAEERLTVDHIYGKAWDVKARNQETRWRRYLKEAHDGLLRVVCVSCNSKLNRRQQLTGRKLPLSEVSEVPF